MSFLLRLQGAELSCRFQLLVLLGNSGVFPILGPKTRMAMKEVGKAVFVIAKPSGLHFENNCCRCYLPRGRPTLATLFWQKTISLHFWKDDENQIWDSNLDHAALRNTIMTGHFAFLEGHETFSGTPWSNRGKSSMGLSIVYHHLSINWWEPCKTRVFTLPYPCLFHRCGRRCLSTLRNVRWSGSA